MRDKVTRCYTVANPLKLSEIDKILKKYEGKEAALFNQVCISLSIFISLNIISPIELSLNLTPSYLI
jgi:hypothetical protein